MAANIALAAVPFAARVAGNVLQGLDPAKAGKVKQQAQEFEAVYIGQMLNQMSSGIGNETGFDGGHAEQQWRSLLNEHIGRSISAGGGVGLADGVRRELMRLQEVAR
jgi:Rod binding domain-containing protein